VSDNLDTLKASLKDQEAFVEEAALDAAYEEGVDACIAIVRDVFETVMDDHVILPTMEDVLIEKMNRLKEVIIG
jgi:hypothetical protein